MSCFKCSAKAEAFTFGYARRQKSKDAPQLPSLPFAPAPLSTVALALVALFVCRLAHRRVTIIFVTDLDHSRFFAFIRGGEGLALDLRLSLRKSAAKKFRGRQ